MIDKAVHRFTFMEVREVVEAGQEAAEPLRAAGELWELANGLGFVAISLLSLGRFDEAAAVDGELEPLAQRIGHHGALMNALRARGQRDFFVSGRLDGLEAFATHDLALCRSAGMPWLTSHSMTWLGLVSFWRGDWEVAGERFEEATRLELPGFLYGLDYGFLILHRTYTGAAREGLAMLDEAAADLPRVGQPNTWGSWRLLLSAVEALVIAGQNDRAALLYPAVLDSQKTGVVTAVPDGRLVERVAAIAAAAGRQWEAAEEHRNALCQADELPHRLEQAETRRFFARMLLERDGPGDRAEATQMAAEAADLYRRMGMPRHFELAAGLLNAS
jgi:tetratricopeptide (TPR) repeat protein